MFGPSLSEQCLSYASVLSNREAGLGRLPQELALICLIYQPENGGRLCCTNRVRDSSRESSMVAGLHEQTRTPNLQDQELAGLQ